MDSVSAILPTAAFSEGEASRGRAAPPDPVRREPSSGRRRRRRAAFLGALLIHLALAALAPFWLARLAKPVFHGSRGELVIDLSEFAPAAGPEPGPVPLAAVAAPAPAPAPSVPKIETPRPAPPPPVKPVPVPPPPPPIPVAPVPAVVAPAPVPDEPAAPAAAAEPAPAAPATAEPAVSPPTPSVVAAAPSGAGAPGSGVSGTGGPADGSGGISGGGGASWGPGSTSSGRPGGPAPVSSIHPRYPMGSRFRGEEGLVRVKVRVDAKGRPVAAEVAASSGFQALDEAAVQAVRNARFEAPGPDAPPESFTAELGIRFQLKN